MAKERGLHSEDGDGRRTRALAGLAAALLLLVVGLMLVRALSHHSATEDCLMAGRLNCAPIDPTTLVTPAR